MAVSDQVFAAQLPRGPHRSRYYLQCFLSDTAENWPDKLFWEETRLWMGDNTVQNVETLDNYFVPL